MKGLYEKAVPSKFSCRTKSDYSNSEPQSSDTKLSKVSLLSSIFASAFSVFETNSELSSSATEKKTINNSRSNGWTTTVKRVVTGVSMRRIQERVFGTSKTGIFNSTSDIWLLGMCYKISQEESPNHASSSSELAEFEQDFSSRILMTYRKGPSHVNSAFFFPLIDISCISHMLLSLYS